MLANKPYHPFHLYQNLVLTIRRAGLLYYELFSKEMAIRFCGFLLMVLITAADGPEIKLTRQTMGDKISLLVPDNFYDQKDDDMAARFPSNRRPVALYSNVSKTVDLSLNISNTVWAEEDVDLLLKFYKANILSLYTKVVFSTEEVQKINKHRYAVFEFTCESNGGGGGPRRSAQIYLHSVHGL